MADLATQKVVDAGTAPTFGAISAADTAEVGNGRNTFYVIKNGDAVNAKTVTIEVLGNTDYGQPTPDPAISVPASGERWIPLRKAYDQGDGTGRAKIAVTGTGGLGSVTGAVVRVG